MKRAILIILLFTGWALAQNGEKVKAELERTDQVISTVRPIVEQSGNEAAKRLLNNAERLQNDAWDKFKNQQFEKALKLTLAARESAREALAAVKLRPKDIEAHLRKTADFMRDVGPLVIRSGIPKAIELWKMADGELASAKEELRKGHYGLALKFGIAAREHAWSAFQFIRKNADPDKVKAELERTDDLIKRVSEQVKLVSTERIQQLLKKAVSLQEQARTALNERRFGPALKLTWAARDLILRAWENAKGGGNASLVERAIAETDQLIKNWSDDIRNDSNAEAQQLLEQALTHQDQAHQHFEAKEFKAAFQETSLARRLLNRAIELIRTEEPTPAPEPRQLKP
jgi:uncharacterized protein YdcH (DUF465 family)